jgi:two-component system chemotaxis response regulator CheB
VIPSQVKVLVVDDSKVALMFLVHLLESDPQIRVIGAVHDGEAALDFVRETRPDVILMDIHMPRMDGFEATRRIMETHPVPIVICSGTMNRDEVAVTFRLLEAGAVACLEKPMGSERADSEGVAANLLETVKLMAEVKVVRRWPRSQRIPIPKPVPAPAAAERGGEGIRVIGIGASTGGPQVLQTILAGFSKDFSVPVLVVQHIAHGFLPGLADWLTETTGVQVQIAAYGLEPLPGHAYLAPDDFHMGLSSTGRILLTRQPPEEGLRPAVAYLFRSLAEVCGPHAVGVLLTGMGRDGAAELKMMKDKGAVTIAQDRESSVVHGMPGAAIELGAASCVVAADRIAETLNTLVNPGLVPGRSKS